MKKITILLLMICMSSLSWAGTAREDATDRLNNAAKVLNELMATPDQGIPQEILHNAKCVAVVPNLLKGGLGFGGKHGKGVASCRNANGWSAPVFFTVGGGSWGLQIGVQAVDLVMIFQNEKGMQRLIDSKFKIGGEASAAAGPVGRHASANTNWKMETEILTYSRAKGLFAGVTLEGASVRRDDDSTRAIYGSKVSNKKVLTGQVKAPAVASGFLAAVAGAKAESAKH